jgi:hypothetical protein
VGFCRSLDRARCEAFKLIAALGKEYGVGDDLPLRDHPFSIFVTFIERNQLVFYPYYGVEPLVFLCIVDPAWRKEDEIVY